MTTTSDQKTAVYGPPRKLARREAAGFARRRPAEEQEDDQDELGADRDRVPAHERLPLALVEA